MTLSQLEKKLSEVVPTYHHEADKAQVPYAVYSEYRKRNVNADNKALDGWWRVQVDYFTKLRKDPNADRIAVMLTLEEVSHTYARVYEPGSKYVRHIFDCDGIRDG